MDLKRIYAGWLIDGGGGPVLRNVVVEFTGERILSIHEEALSDDTSEEILDYSECTLIPGLVDCHVHLCMSGTTDKTIREQQLVAGFDDARDAICRHLDRHLTFGVVAVRDGGDHHGFSKRFKVECDAITPPPVRIRTAGKAWHAPGRYGSLIGRPPEDGESLSRAVLREAVDIDHVKIVNSGVNSLIRYGKETLPQFSVDALMEAVTAAGSRGLPVMVHANGVQPVLSAVSAGVHSIEHGYFMGTENLERMRDADMTWVPTAYAMKAFTDPGAGKNRILTQHRGENPQYSFLEEQIRIVAQKTLDHQLEQIRIARERGVKIAVGTDSGSIGVNHGNAIVQEIALLLGSGFSIPEAIGCASGIGMKLLRLENLGHLAPGKEATFTAVKGAPRELPESLGRIVALYIKGKRVSLESSNS